MAILNLNKKKIMSESNYRRLINILVGLMASQSTIEAQCLTEYEPIDRVYQRGNITIYNGYIWEAKTVAQGTFDESKWTKIGTDSFTELDLDTIKSYLNLSQDELDNLQNLIDDAQITLTKTHSSSKIYMDIQQCLEDGKTFTLKEISKLSGASYKVVASTGEMTSESIIYLLPNATNYDMYIVETDGTAQKIGDMDIDLSQYYTKDEVDSDFLKKTDADGKYATITTVDGKVDKTSILSATSSSATDDQVYSAKAINTELDGVVKKTDITTTINSTSTDTKVPSAKAVNTLLNNKVDKMVMLKSQNVDDLVNEGSYYVIEAINAPDAYGWIDVLANNDYTIQLFYPSITTNCEMYIRRRQNGVWSSGWQRVCTTKVADVPLTSVPLKDGYGGDVAYSVKNGYCLVLINGLTVPTSTVGATEFANVKLPCNRSNLGWVLMTNIDGDCGTLVTVDVHGDLIHHKSDSTKTYFGQYMYEVKEP